MPSAPLPANRTRSPSCLPRRAPYSRASTNALLITIPCSRPRSYRFGRGPPRNRNSQMLRPKLYPLLASLLAVPLLLWSASVHAQTTRAVEAARSEIDPLLGEQFQAAAAHDTDRFLE